VNFRVGNSPFIITPGAVATAIRLRQRQSPDSAEDADEKSGVESDSVRKAAQFGRSAAQPAGGARPLGRRTCQDRPDARPSMHVIHPNAVEVGIDDLYGVERPRPTDRPWVGICMISSLDGTTVVDGRSGALGNATDAAVLGALRRAADVVLVGAGTAKAEAYGPPKQQGLRIGVVTASGEVELSSDLFTSGAGFLVMPEDGPPDPPPACGRVDVVRAGLGLVDLALAVRRLGTVVDDPAFVQCEGGPRLNGALLTSGCVDEIDLTVSPFLAGGDGLRVAVGAPAVLARFDLAHVATDDGYLYGRWVRRDVSPGSLS